MSDLYTGEWRRMMNLFQPSVKLQSKVRKGSHLARRYDTPQTPLDRLRQAKCGDAHKLAALLQQRQVTDPFALAVTIKRQVEKIWDLAHLKPTPRVSRKREFRYSLGTSASLTNLLYIKTVGVFAASASDRANCPKTPKIPRPSTLLKMQSEFYVC